MDSPRPALVQAKSLPDGSWEYTVLREGKPLTKSVVVADETPLRKCFERFGLAVDANVRGWGRIGHIRSFPVSDADGYIRCAGFEAL